MAHLHQSIGNLLVFVLGLILPLLMAAFEPVKAKFEAMLTMEKLLFTVKAFWGFVDVDHEATAVPCCPVSQLHWILMGLVSRSQLQMFCETHKSMLPSLTCNAC
jgi:hypothetical protein